MIIIQIVNFLLTASIMAWLAIELEIDSYKKLIYLIAYLVLFRISGYVIRDIMQILGVL